MQLYLLRIREKQTLNGLLRNRKCIVFLKRHLIKGVRNRLISIGFLILVAKIFEVFGFDAGFEGPQPYSKISILISNRNLLLRNFWLRFRNII